MSEPADEAVAERVRANFAGQAFMTTIGARLRSVEAGRVVIEIVPSPALAQQHGYVHAGVVATIADSACGYAALSLMPPESDVLSVEFKLNLLNPAVGEMLTATGTVLRAGGRLSVCQAEVHAVTGSERILVAQMLATMIRRNGTGDSSGGDA